LAFSIHHVAIILGEELTRTDLVPVFDELIKDLDEVRIGLLQHLVDFLQVTHLTLPVVIIVIIVVILMFLVQSSQTFNKLFHFPIALLFWVLWANLLKIQTGLP